jgi:hypothetical protein
MGAPIKARAELVATMGKHQQAWLAAERQAFFNLALALTRSVVSKPSLKDP